MAGLFHMTGFMCGNQRTGEGAARSAVCAGVPANPTAADDNVLADAGRTTTALAVRASFTGWRPGVSHVSTSSANQPTTSGLTKRSAEWVIRTVIARSTSD